MSALTIVAGGVERDEDFLRRHLHSPFWCADRGLLLTLPLGFCPVRLIGDLDSLTEAEVAWAVQRGCVVERYSPEKDESDLELAVRRAAELGFTELTLLGLVGGRFDHALVNVLGVLGLAGQLGLRARALSSREVIVQLEPGRYSLEAPVGTLCSLLPISESASGVTLRGFAYPLQNGRLVRASSRGLSNVVESHCAELVLGEGTLLAFLHGNTGLDEVRWRLQ